jgi:hypothetical protein
MRMFYKPGMMDDGVGRMEGGGAYRNARLVENSCWSIGCLAKLHSAPTARVLLKDCMYAAEKVPVNAGCPLLLLIRREDTMAWEGLRDWGSQP